MLEKVVTIGDRQIRFRSSAAIPRLYRIKFRRDIFKDLTRLEKTYREKARGRTTDNPDTEDAEQGSTFEVEDLEIFENVAYIMALHADQTVPGTIDEWLEQFEMFSIYEILPEILELWGSNLATDATSKKNFTPRNGK